MAREVRDDAARERLLNNIVGHLSNWVTEPVLLSAFLDLVLNDPTARFRDLGADYHATRINTERRTRNYVTQLMAMGYRVTLEPAV